MKRRTTWFFAVAFTLVAFALSMHLATVRNRQKADEILQLIQSVRNGSKLKAEERVLLNTFPVECHPRTASRPDYCSYNRTLENTWLRIFGLAPRKVFVATVVVSDNKVLETSVGLAQERGPEVMVIDRGQDDSALKPINVLAKENYSYIILTSRSTEDERRTALNLNLEVLTQSGRMDKVSEIFNSRPPESRN